MERHQSPEEYIKERGFNLTKDGEKILLAAIKNGKFNFKYKDKVAQPGSIEGQDKIMGLGMHIISRKNGEEMIYLDSGVYREIIIDRFDIIIDAIVREINLALREEIEAEKLKNILVEATEENVENLIERVYNDSMLVYKELERRGVLPKAAMSPIKDFKIALNAILSKEKGFPNFAIN